MYQDYSPSQPCCCSLSHAYRSSKTATAFCRTSHVISNIFLNRTRSFMAAISAQLHRRLLQDSHTLYAFGIIGQSRSFANHTPTDACRSLLVLRLHNSDCVFREQTA